MSSLTAQPSALAKKGQQRHTGMSLLPAMQPNALAPDVITYNAAIRACGKGQQPHAAMSLLPSMQPNALAPNVITYSAAISRLKHRDL